VAMSAISIQQIVKTFPGKHSVVALDHVDLLVESGELFGIIGPDGAGKTTLFRIIATLLLADEGTATLRGMDVVRDYKKIRKVIGYMPGKFSLYQDLTVEENIQFFATLFLTSLEENYDLIKDIYVQLEPFKDRKAGKLSGGMKQKLALCCALIHRPDVLLLDEPTTGVDPVSRKEFWEMLGRLKTSGMTIVVSTPYMDEAVLCDRIALMQTGKILQTDTPQGIIDSYALQLLAIGGDHLYDTLQLLRHFEGTANCFAFGDKLHLSLKDNSYSAASVTAYLEKNGRTDTTVEPIQPGIEDCFMAYL
jgi:ABC-2 type transport system ATP-binding protein